MAGKGDRAELEQLLSSYIDGACSQEERDRVQEALQHDPEFRALYTQLVRTIEAVGAMPSEAAPSHVRERILSKLERRALLGVASVAAAPPARQGPSRSRPTAWLGLLAAAMLVAGVGATWWIRMHEEKAPSQLAMAPTPPLRDGRIIVRENVPQERHERTQGLAGMDRPTDEGDTQYGTKVAQLAPALPSPLAQASPPSARALPSPPPQVVAPAVAASPQAPILADRAGFEARGKDGISRQVADRALAMGGRERAGLAGKPEVVQSFGVAATETTGAAPMAEAAPPPEAKNVHPAPGGAGDASRLAGEPGKSRQAPAADALAAAPTDTDITDLAAKEAAAETAGTAPVLGRQLVAAPMAGMPVTAMARAGSAGSAGAHSVAGGLQEASEPAVTQLQVSVRDVGRQVASTGGFIRTLVTREDGQAVEQADPSVILAAVPAGRQQPLAESIALVPGVLDVRSRVLPAGDPLASQALSLAAEQWMQAFWRQFLEPVAWQSSPALVRPYHLAGHSCVSEMPVFRQEYTPLVIVLQSVRPAASEPASQ